MHLQTNAIQPARLCQCGYPPSRRRAPRLRLGLGLGRRLGGCLGPWAWDLVVVKVDIYSELPVQCQLLAQGNRRTQSGQSAHAGIRHALCARILSAWEKQLDLARPPITPQTQSTQANQARRASELLAALIRLPPSCCVLFPFGSEFMGPRLVNAVCPLFI